MLRLYTTAMKRFIFITNAGLDVGWLETLYANLVYQIGLIPITVRKAQLTHREYVESAPLLRRGDIVLVGQSRYVSALFIRGVFTHSLIYIGDGECIEARGRGVHLVSYESLFSHYDRLAILRVDGLTEEQANGVVDFALEHIGDPYDFWLDYTDRRAWFCTELICAALVAQGVTLPVCVGNRFSPPHPSSFYHGGAAAVYTSDRVETTDHRIQPRTDN